MGVGSIGPRITMTSFARRAPFSIFEIFLKDGLENLPFAPFFKKGIFDMKPSNYVLLEECDNNLYNYLYGTMIYHSL